MVCPAGMAVPFDVRFAWLASVDVVIVRAVQRWAMVLSSCSVRHPLKLDRVTSNPARMNGQPCVRDLRLTVRRVVELVDLYPDRAELRREFPEWDEEDIRQALVYAAVSSDDRVVELVGNHETAA